MEQLITHPAVQAVVLPFAVALLAAAALRHTRHLGLSIAAGFLCAVALTMGFGFQPLTSVRKLVWVGIAVAAAAVVLEATTSHPRWAQRLAIAAGVAIAVLWVLQRLLLQRDAGAALLAGAGAVAYCLALLVSGERVSADPVRAAAMTLVLGWASGALALFGASAQLAQLGIALGAGAGAVLLLQMLAGASAPGGWTLALAALVIAGLVGLLAVFTGSLPWYCLLPLPLVAWFAKLVPADTRPVWQRAGLAVLSALVPAVIAVVLARYTAGEAAA